MRLINFPRIIDILTNSIADPVILREAKRSRRIELSFYANWNVFSESIGEPIMDSATPDKDVLRAEWHDGWLTMNLRTPGFVRFINFPKNPNFLMNALCWHRHSAHSKTKSRKLNVILREAKPQNPKMKMTAGKGGPWKEKSALTKKLWIL